jgi:hypothetical protein
VLLYPGTEARRADPWASAKSSRRENTISSKSDLLRAPWDDRLRMCELMHRRQKQSPNIVYLRIRRETAVKTRRPDNSPTPKTLRIRYAELLRLREEVQRLAVSCTAEPPAALIPQSEDGVVPGQHFVSNVLPCGRRETDSRPMKRAVRSERSIYRARQSRGVHSGLRCFDKSRPE